MINQFDRAILRVLQQDGRISNVELAERVNLSESACLRRVRVLEKSGLIKGSKTCRRSWSVT
jgi:Lrp/AsnC family leucine-responsive transcriptional regulator